MTYILQGMMISGGMIIAIGGQNAFVLKQGLLKRNIFWVALTCFLCDFLLMTIGVMGLGTIISSNRWLAIGLALFGAAFLGWFGIRSLLSAYRGSSSLEAQQDGMQAPSAKAAVAATLGMTLLNPHVYLDTVVIVGGVAGTLLPAQKWQFLFGALLASFIWFFSLGYGAQFLSPWFRQKKTWVVLDTLIGCFMFFIAYGLLSYGIAQF